MLQLEQTGRSARQLVWWHALLILLAITSLSASLATRVWSHDVSHAVEVQAGASQGMRQHMDRDAAHWVAPVPRLTFWQTVTFYPKFAPARPLLPVVLFEKSLYNRPPPSFFPLA